MRKLCKPALVMFILFGFIFNPLVYTHSLSLSLVYEKCMSHFFLPNETTDFKGSILLGSPTNHYVCVNILADDPCDLYLVWGLVSQHYMLRTNVTRADTMEPAVLTINNLQPGQRYFYRLFFKGHADESYSSTEEYSFQTPRFPGEEFTFVIQSDSHLYALKDDEVYLASLKAMAQFQPDFAIDLGDTFIHDKVSHAQERSMQQRPYFDLLSRNAPLFLALGNHDGEAGKYFDGTNQSLAVVATQARKKYYLNPEPNEFYSGNIQIEPFVGLPHNYYAFEWGDALFVVLDYYRYSPFEDIPSSNAWSWTLGKSQYDWFKKTLEDSNARFKFVFAHHANGIGRGGQVYSSLFEWGGYDPRGRYLFDEMRPGWGKPIHQIMKDYGVSIYFQGHDHVFAMERVDGIIYQTVPRVSEKYPSRSNVFALYPNAHLLLNSGFLKVTVSSEEVKISFYRSYFVSTDPQEGNTGIVFVYAIDADRRVSILQDKKDDLSKYK
jgi:hypothetical protein